MSKDYSIIGVQISLAGDCGDHVVVINSAHIALPGDEWEMRVFYHHSGYAKGGSWTLAHKVHERDPTMVRNRFGNVLLIMLVVTIGRIYTLRNR